MAKLQRAWTAGIAAIGMALAAGGTAMADDQPKAGGTAGNAAGGAGPGGVPKTEKRPVEETLFGKKLVDNYRWLEGDNSDAKQMGKRTPEVDAWTDAQNGYTRSILDNLPGRKALEEKLRPLMEVGSVSAPIMRGEWYFYTKREGSANQPTIYAKHKSWDKAKVLLDPAVVDPTGLTALGGMVPSQDGKYLAVGLYKAGDENTTVYVIDTNTGMWLPDQIEGKAAVTEWLPTGNGFFYERLGDVNNPYSAQIKVHILGYNPKGDPMLFRQYLPSENKELATTWGPGATFSKDGKWMVLNYWTGGSSQDIWCVDLTKAGWGKPINESLKVIKTGAKNKFTGEIQGDTFYMITDYKAPRNHIVAVDLNNPEEDHWKVFVPENKDATLKGFGLAKGMLVANYEEKASTKLRTFSMDGKAGPEVKLPGIGTASISTEDDRTEAYLSFTSFNYPPTVFKVDLAKADAEPAVWERPAVPVDPSTVEVNQVTYSSKDGTPVTMFLVHKKGLKLDGTNPTILNAYGGFDISMTPSFSATLFQWLDAGGVYALPNLRGGGEYGKAWHEAGMKDQKQNVFNDMISAAEWLIANKYTSPKKLATTGGSNGGLLMGAMMTQRPDLFGAIICAVPLLDMVRFQNFLMARYWVGEYGTAENEADFGWLIKYSPYQNIKEGVKYPAILFTAGENDTRVHALHARKMAAAMQAATTSDPKEKPVMLWVDREGGHGQGKPLNLRIRDAADQRIFIMWQLGMLEGGEK
ncbi:MAG: prolyl oligopeptidase family serine peptidase [Phycisphaerales bacterium]